MSPKRPKKIAPKGRTINPAANVARVAINAATGLSEGKNLVDNRVAKEPKM